LGPRGRNGTFDRLGPIVLSDAYLSFGIGYIYQSWRQAEPEFLPYIYMYLPPSNYFLIHQNIKYVKQHIHTSKCSVKHGFKSGATTTVKRMMLILLMLR
jgi:hypothetical protein